MRPADFIRKALQTGRRVAPSQHDPWHGTPAPGSMWTYQQLAALKEAGILPEAIKTATVGVQVQNTLNWAMPPQTRPIVCPRLAVTRNGRRALIITPAGDKLWKDIV